MDDVNVTIAAKATALMNEGDAALKKFSITSLFGNGNNAENAFEKYQQAMNNYKVAKDWRGVVNASVKCAEMATLRGIAHETANYYTSAGDAAKKYDQKLAMKYYKQACDVYCESGKFATAAKQMEAIAEILEAEQSLELAVSSFKQAADFYAGENQTAKASKCLEKVAHLNGTLGKYDLAANTFEELGTAALDNNLLTFNAKKHFLKAGICILARGDYVAAEQAYKRYSTLDYTFASSREGTLFNDLIKACDEDDSETFTDKLFDYDRISKLEPWSTSILLKVKKSLSNGAGGVGAVIAAGGKEDDDGMADLS